MQGHTLANCFQHDFMRQSSLTIYEDQHNARGHSGRGGVFGLCVCVCVCFFFFLEGGGLRALPPSKKTLNPLQNRRSLTEAFGLRLRLSQLGQSRLLGLRSHNSDCWVKIRVLVYK